MKPLPVVSCFRIPQKTSASFPVLWAATIFALAAALVSSCAGPAPALTIEAPERERINFDANWRYIQGDPADAGDTLAYARLKTALLANSNFADYVVRPTAGVNPGRKCFLCQTGLRRQFLAAIEPAA